MIEYVRGDATAPRGKGVKIVARGIPVTVYDFGV